MMTDKAPSGVTRMAGANVYAAKLATIEAWLNERFFISYAAISL